MLKIRAEVFIVGLFNLILFEKTSLIRSTEMQQHKLPLCKVENLTQISRSPVFIKVAEATENLNFEQRFSETVVSVSSARLDCFVSSIIGVSRGKAKEMISSELVYLNSFQQKNPDKNIEKNDILSIRGYGRFIVDDFLRQSRKGKMQYKIRKFV